MVSYTVPELPYAYDALEPYIDARTMEIHHTDLHQGYVDSLNRALDRSDQLRSLAEQSIDDLLWNFGKIPQGARAAVRNFGGGHANHSLLWAILSDDGGGEPSGDLAQAIEEDFGSFSEFTQSFARVAANHFGSGWAWLVRTRNRLVIYSLPNQDSPLTAEETPILGLDVWEHAYYLKYENRRSDYVEGFWSVVNWGEVNRRYANALP